MEYVWKPDAALIEQANITRLMRRLGHELTGDPGQALAEARKFVARTQKDITWFWDAAL